jgi:hypothetical protein
MATAHDGNGNALDSHTISVFVGAVPNEAPIADAGPDDSVDEGAQVALSGSGTDSDGTVATYAWTQTAGRSVTLVNANTATASFDAPEVDEAGASLTFELTVTDDDDATGTDDVTITVDDVPANGDIAMAILGDRTVVAGESFQLHVSASDGDAATTEQLATNASMGNFDANGDGSHTFAWATTASDDGTYQVTFTANNSEESVSETINLTVTCADACGTATNEAPVVDSFDTAESSYSNEQPNTVEVTAGIFDSDGADSIDLSGITAQYTIPGALEATDVDSADMTLVNGTTAGRRMLSFGIEVARGSVEGVWVLDLTVTDTQGLETSSSTSFEVIQPLGISYDGGFDYLDFGTFVRNQSAASTNQFIVTNNRDHAVNISFDMTDFVARGRTDETNPGACTDNLEDADHDVIPVKCNAYLEVFVDGVAMPNVSVDAGIVRLASEVPADASVTARLHIVHVPSTLVTGAYTAGFAIYEA